MVTVYFRNGNGKAEISNGATVRPEGFQFAGAMGAETYSGIAIYDKDSKLVGRFLSDQIIGYDLKE